MGFCDDNEPEFITTYVCINEEKRCVGYLTTQRMTVCYELLDGGRYVRV